MTPGLSHAPMAHPGPVPFPPTHPSTWQTRQALESPIVPLLLGIPYALLFWQAWQAGALTAIVDAVRTSAPLPDVTALAAVFKAPTLTAMAWLHLLLLDLLQAKWVAKGSREGRRGGRAIERGAPSRAQRSGWDYCRRWPVALSHPEPSGLEPPAHPDAHEHTLAHSPAPPCTRFPLPWRDRAVLVDGLKYAVPTAHSVALCCMFGPLGVLSHLATRWVVNRARGSKASLAPFA